MSEREHENPRPVQLFCPADRDVVDTRKACAFCYFWDGRQCAIVDRLKAAQRDRHLRRRLNKWLGLRRLATPRRGGRGLNVPPVREKWPRSRPEPDDSGGAEEETNYGLAGSYADAPETPTESCEPDQEIDSQGPDLADLLREVSDQAESADMRPDAALPDVPPQPPLPPPIAPVQEQGPSPPPPDGLGPPGLPLPGTPDGPIENQQLR